jgi:hypothetical protein
MAAPPSAQDLERLRSHTPSALRDVLGHPPFAVAPPLNPRVVYTADGGSYWRRKVRYGNETDDVVWAWLLVPKTARQPVPAVLCLAGSFMTPNYGKEVAGERTTPGLGSHDTAELDRRLPSWTRVAAIAPVCGWSPLDLDAVAACIAPRPFLDVKATADEFFHAHNADAARETQAWFYRWLWQGDAR